MIAVAVVGALLGRWMDLRNRERYHRHELTKILISDLEFYLACTQAQGAPIDGQLLDARIAVQPISEFQRYHCEMREKYEWAFRHPWYPVAFDPPAPPLPSPKYQKAFRAKYLDPLLANQGSP